MGWFMLLLASMLYLRLTHDKVIGGLTKPDEDWLVGFEHIPEIQLPELDWKGSMVSIGIFFYRVDFIKHKKEE